MKRIQQRFQRKRFNGLLSDFDVLNIILMAFLIVCSVPMNVLLVIVVITATLSTVLSEDNRI